MCVCVARMQILARLRGFVKHDPALCVCVCVCEPPPHQPDPQRGGGVDRVHAPLARSGEIATHLTPNGVAGQRRDA